jgi:hypothetical protein
VASRKQAYLTFFKLKGGDVKKLAKLVNRSVSTIRRWKRTVIPEKIFESIIEYVTDRGELNKLAIENLVASGMWSYHRAKQSTNFMSTGQLTVAGFAEKEELENLAADIGYWDENYGDEYGYDDHDQDDENPFWYHD